MDEATNSETTSELPKQAQMLLDHPGFEDAVKAIVLQDVMKYGPITQAIARWKQAGEL